MDLADTGQGRRLIWYPGHDLLLPGIVRAENCHLYDSLGRRYVDLESGVWCTSIGHAHPRVLRAMAAQAAQIAHTGFCYSSSVVDEAAREVLSLLGFEGGRCVFLCSGSEAVEYGVRTAQLILPGRLLMTMADSYFGAYGSAQRRSGDEWFSFDWAECAQCTDRQACGEGCGRWAAIPYECIGGFVFEPGSSSGLVRFPPEKLVRSIVARVRESGGLILVNEVTTGIGRTGHWFGYQHYGISPDVVALGKGLGNGYPVSVSAFAPGVVERLGGQVLRYSQSHQNDPLGASIAREVIAVIREEGLIERGREIAAVLRVGLDGIRESTGKIRAIRSHGLMVALELEDDAACSFTVWAHRELVERGFVVERRPGLSLLRLDPSLTIEKADVEAFLAALEAVLTSAHPRSP